MPELPEVETIRKHIASQLTGSTIVDVNVLLPRLIKWPQPDVFKAVLINKQVVSVNRRGKYLLLELSDNWVLIIHLRMTGRLFYRADMETDQYARIIFLLDNRDRLVYADTRTLGTLYLLKNDELWRISGLNSLGPEPLTADFTQEYFQSLKKKKAQIKAVLLNQEFIGGLGNIYVDESLALANIHPARLACSLSPIDIERLYHAINKVISDGIKHGGTSFRDYRDGLGKKGSHQDYLAVYGRAGQPCKKCGTLIKKTVIAGRGTSFCPHCQQ